MVSHGLCIAALTGSVADVLFELFKSGFNFPSRRLAKVGLSKQGKKLIAEFDGEAQNLAFLRLVIVCDMWLTGFDASSLHTLYTKAIRLSVGYAVLATETVLKQAEMIANDLAY
jgi:hypothetical protein